jgi:hypothetical protein
MTSFRYLLALLCALMSALSASAHDRFEGTIDIHSSGECLEIVVLIPAATSSLILKSNDNNLVTKDTLATHRDALLAAAEALSGLLDDAGKPVRASNIQLSVGENGELCYLFEYPSTVRPAALTVSILNTLPNRHFFVVSDHRSQPARRAVLVRDKTDFAMNTPAASATP